MQSPGKEAVPTLDDRLSNNPETYPKPSPRHPIAQTSQSLFKESNASTNSALFSSNLALQQIDAHLPFHVIHQINHTFELFIGLFVASLEHQRFAPAFGYPVANGIAGLVDIAICNRVVARRDFQGRLSSGLLGG